MKNILIAVVAVFGLMVGTASAAELSYDNVTVGVTHINVADSIGAVVQGSFSVTDNVFLVGEAGYDYNNDLDGGLVQARFGVGTRLALAEGTDFYGTAYGLYGEVTQNHTNHVFDTWGYGVEAGVRTLLTDTVELKLGASHERYNALDLSDNYLNAAASYHFNDAMAGTVGVRHAMDGGYQAMVGVQFKF